MPDSLDKQLRELEERLLRPEVRHNRTEVGRLLADDFREFGSSGRVFNKTQILDGLANETSDTHLVMSQFAIRVLAFDVVLTTYVVSRMTEGKVGAVTSLRSSIWKLRNGDWQMVFHQGTLTESDLTEN